MPTPLDVDLAEGLGTIAILASAGALAYVSTRPRRPRAERIARNRRAVRWLLGWPAPAPGHYRIRLAPAGVRLVDLDVDVDPFIALGAAGPGSLALSRLAADGILTIVDGARRSYVTGLAR